jgi:hypothetical protein
MKALLAWFLAALVVPAAALPAAAHGRPALRGSVEIDVVTDRGSILRSIPYRDFRDGGTRVIKRYLEATRGENYGIVVHNRSDERVGVVIAVDGRNIITGDRSELGRRESLYIVNAGASARFDGWRTSRTEVHRFFFTGSGNSYSQRTFGDVSAMGLIAVAVYRERERPAPPAGKLKQESAPAPSAGRSAEDAASLRAKEQAGTGFGEGTYSPVILVEFDAERTADRRILVKYEWTDVLCRKGLISCGQPKTRLWDDARYAPFPPGD